MALPTQGSTLEAALPQVQFNGLNTLKASNLAGLLVDTSGNTTIPGTLAVTGAITATGGVAGALIGSTQSLTGSGAANVTTLTTKLNTTGGGAITLADGTDGQLKIITLDVDGGDATITPATKTGFSTVVFDNAGDTALFVFVTTRGWMCVATNGGALS